MDDLDYDFKAQLHNNYFVELKKLLEEYHNKKTKISVGNRIGLSKDGSRLKSLTLGIRGPFFLSIRKDKTFMNYAIVLFLWYINALILTLSLLILILCLQCIKIRKI